MRHRLVVSIIFTALCLMFYSAQARETGQSKEQLERGKRLYLSYCASCHGVDASGKGPVASALKQPPPDLRRFQAKAGQSPAEELRKKIAGDLSLPVHGKSDMPVWGRILSRADINNLVKYLESIQRPFEAQPAG
jgi:mono/diheme cytochrome c family protein